MHMFVTWLWRKCLNRSCSKTDARSVVFASGGLFASKGVANVVFFTDRVCPGFCEAYKSEAGRRLEMGGSRSVKTLCGEVNSGTDGDGGGICRDKF